MDKILKFATEKFAKNRCLGTRSIIEEKKVDGPNGKKFTKLVMEPSYKWQTYEEVYQNSTFIGRHVFYSFHDYVMHVILIMIDDHF